MSKHRTASVEVPRCGPAVRFRKARIGWWVEGAWCPPWAIRDRLTSKLLQQYDALQARTAGGERYEERDHE